MKAEIKKSLLINPENHHIAVNHFLDHFQIKSKQPDLEYLESILLNFAKLPYENISKIVKLEHAFTSPDRLRLPEEVMQEHAEHSLGGTCFSLTFFLSSILLDRGFDCYPIIASMHNRPNAHSAIVVRYKHKKYLIDPGYLLTTPLELSNDRPRIYKTPQSGIELVFNQNNGHYFLCTFDLNQKRWRYFFQDTPVPISLFQQHWYESFYKSTMHGICMTKIRNDGLIYIHKDLLQISTLEGKRKQRIQNNYHQIVQDIFGIEPEFIEKALNAINVNIKKQKQLGLFHKNERTYINETD